MIKNKILIIIILCSTLLLSCDPGHEITFTFENNSSKQIVLISQTFNAEKITIAPNESIIAKHSGLGGYKYIKAQEYCPCEDKDLQIYPADTMFKITKDIKNSNNWTRTSKRKYIIGGVFTCKFILEDQDIK